MAIGAGKPVDFISPRIPFGAAFTCEKFDERAGAIAFDPPENFVGLARMLAPRRQDEFAHILLEAPAVTAAT